MPKLTQPRLTDDRRIAALSCLHPTLAALVKMDADLRGTGIGWAINDALADHYGAYEVKSDVLFALASLARERRRERRARHGNRRINRRRNGR